MRALQKLLPSMPEIEGTKLTSLDDVRALDNVGFNLVMTYFTENVRTQKNMNLFKEHI